MIPILYDGFESSFTGNGLGRLTDCISCIVTEERNGIYECEFTYPITGIHYEDIAEGKVVLVTHDERKDKQPFIIYRRSVPNLNGVVTFSAHHISYLLANVILAPFTAETAATALAGFTQYALTENNFTFWTDKTSSGSFAVKVPTSAKSALGGKQGSVLSVFGGGEYEWDGYTVKLFANRGTNSGVTIRYGKNLADLSYENDTMGLYNSVIPYWAEGDTVVYGGRVAGDGSIRRVAYWTDETATTIEDENGTPFQFGYAETQTLTMDLSSEFEEEPTATQLRERARAILNSNKPWIPKVNVKVDFVALWQTEEYKNIAPLERVRLCDTVTVYYSQIGLSATAKVIKTVWNPLLERYDSMELGDAKTSFAETLLAETEEQMREYPSKSFMEKEIEYATKQITGGMGGNIVFTLNANGQPIEQLIMDTDDKETAVNVWRWNLGGLGHSHSGYEGPFDDVAITQDGRINASMITTGHMRANRIQGGTLTLGGANDGNGILQVLNASGTLIGEFDSNGIYIYSGVIQGASVVVGGLNNTNGILQVLDASGNIIGQWEAGGIGISKGTIQGPNITVGGSSNTSGTFSVLNASGGVIGKWDKDGINVNGGTITTTDGTRRTTIESGYAKYYYSTSNTYVGDIGAVMVNSEEGLMFDLKPDGDYMGWFLNGTNNPILIYDKSDWLSKDIWGDTLNAYCDFHVSNGYVITGRYANPSWNFSGTNYAGYTGTITISGRSMTFKNGVLTNA